MRMQPFVVSALVLGAVYALTPRAGDGGTFEMKSAAPSSRANPWSKDRPTAAAQAADWNDGGVTLPRRPDGHFYAAVTVDGVSGEMLVDTGASVIALTGNDAEAMGIHWDPADVQPVAQGASGAVYGVPVRLNQVSVGEIEVRGVEAIVVPEGLGISLLGQSFLQRAGRVEIDGETMILGG